MKEKGRGLATTFIVALGVFIGLKLSTPNTAGLNHLPTTAHAITGSQIFHTLLFQMCEAFFLIVLVVGVCFAISELKRWITKSII